MYVDEFCTCDWHEKGDDNGGDGWVKKRGSLYSKKLREMKNDNFWCENSIFPSLWFWTDIADNWVSVLSS